MNTKIRSPLCSSHLVLWPRSPLPVTPNCSAAVGCSEGRRRRCWWWRRRFWRRGSVAAGFGGGDLAAAGWWGRPVLGGGGFGGGGFGGARSCALRADHSPGRRSSIDRSRQVCRAPHANLCRWLAPDFGRWTVDRFDAKSLATRPR